MRKLALGLAVCMLLLSGDLYAQAGRSYIYSYWKKPIPAPASYLPQKVVTGASTGAGDFSSPEDLFVSDDGQIYVADSGNDRILKYDRAWNLVHIYETFMTSHGRDSFNYPNGVFVTRDGLIYVADMKNQRVVVLQDNGSLAKIIGAPTSDLLRPEYKYLPARLVVDKAGRLYVVGPGMFEGIMQFDQDGKFGGFLGSNRVRFNPIDWVWKRIATKQQRQGMMLFIPEEFSSLDIDDQGFIYSTTRDEDAKYPVKKHNAEGIDVLLREASSPPVGDISVNNTGAIKGRSSFVDVSVDTNGVYHCLDAKRGRVFSYDGEGNLISVFGGLGDQAGLFNTPTALDVLDGNILVLDKGIGRITVFAPTEYGKLVREAIVSHDQGDYDMALVLWKRVLEMNSNFELAYTGIGKILLRKKEYAAAMKDFRLGNNRRYYSKAFQHLRKNVLRRVFGPLMGGLLLMIAAIFIARRYRRQDPGRNRLAYASPDLPFHKRMRFSLYILKHPFDGFWDLKFNRIGTLRSATLLLALFVVVDVVKVQFTGFLFNTMDPSQFNLFEEILKSILPIVLFTLGNWSLTSLMDGEGTMRDIYVSLCYALVPIILIYPAITLISNFVTQQEGAFFFFFEKFALVWTAFLIYAGNKTVHNYSPRKTVGMLLLTLVAIGVILFLALLFVTFIEQVWSFGYSVYREIIFRT